MFFCILCVGFLLGCSKKEDVPPDPIDGDNAPPLAADRGVSEEITSNQYKFFEHVSPLIPTNIFTEEDRNRRYSRGGKIYNLSHTPGVDEAFDGGLGSPEDPYVINDSQQFSQMEKHPNAHYVLNRNLTFSEAIESMFRSRPFTGVLDGGGFRIRDIKFKESEEETGIITLGFFSKLGITVQIAGMSEAASFGIVRDLIFESSSIELETSAERSYLGIIAGICEGRIINCHVIGGSVKGESNGTVIGGLVGKIGQAGGVAYSSSSARVEGKNSSGIGGLVGECIGGWIHSSYAVADVIGVNNVGGLVGRQTRFLLSCFSKSSVTGTGENIGGLIGISHAGALIKDCFSRGDVKGKSSVGGLIGRWNESPPVEGLSNPRPMLLANVYTTSKVEGNRKAGGLIGINGGASANNQEVAWAIKKAYWKEGIAKTGGDIGREDGKGGVPLQRTQAQLACPTGPNALCEGDELYEGWEVEVWDFGDELGLPLLRFQKIIETPPYLLHVLQ